MILCIGACICTCINVCMCTCKNTCYNICIHTTYVCVSFPKLRMYVHTYVHTKQETPRIVLKHFIFIILAFTVGIHICIFDNETESTIKFYIICSTGNCIILFMLSSGKYVCTNVCYLKYA